MGRIHRVLGRLAITAVLLALLLSGCGGDGNGGESSPPTDGPAASIPSSGDAAAGRQTFEDAGCGDCHRFAAADAGGSFAPNLDDSDVSFAEAYEQIRDGGGGMPSFGDELSDRELANVAQFVVDERRG
jgi:mono/diheme cytochrome c family protein